MLSGYSELVIMEEVYKLANRTWTAREEQRRATRLSTARFDSKSA
jgi:hypothetical protein